MRGVFVFYDVYMALCAEKGEKPYQLAIELGLKSNSAVAQWAKGSVPRPAMLEKIADHFGVSVGYLLTGETEDPAPAESQSGITGKEWELVRLFTRAGSQGRNGNLYACLESCRRICKRTPWLSFEAC